MSSVSVRTGILSSLAAAERWRRVKLYCHCDRKVSTAWPRRRCSAAIYYYAIFWCIVKVHKLLILPEASVITSHYSSLHILSLYVHF
jgi:hypothetical protein